MRLVFAIPSDAARTLFSAADVSCPNRLAYIEWFTPFTQPEEAHGLYRISRAHDAGDRLVSVVPVDTIRRSVHLYPKFGAVAPREWTSHNVLDECSTFFVNQFTDKHSFKTII